MSNANEAGSAARAEEAYGPWGAEELDALRGIGIGDNVAVSMKALKAFHEGDQQEADRLLDLGADFSHKMPADLMGGEATANMAGNPRLVHFLGNPNIDPDLVRQAGKRIADVNLEDDNGLTVLDYLERKSPSDELRAAWTEVGAQKGSHVSQNVVEVRPAEVADEDPKVVARRAEFIAQADPDGIRAMRRIGLRDDEMISMHFLEALDQNNGPEARKLMAAGATLEKEIPSAVLGGEMEEMLKGGKLAHFVSVSPDLMAKETTRYAVKMMKDVDVRTADGATPLMMSAWSGSRDSVKTWGEAGADLLAKDANGDRAEAYAMMGRHVDLSQDLARKAVRTERVQSAASRSIAQETALSSQRAEKAKSRKGSSEDER